MKKLFVVFALITTLALAGCKEEKTKPEITFNDSFETTYEVGSTEPNWADAITVTDKKDKTIEVESSFIDTTNVDMSSIGTFDVIFTVKNSSDLEAVYTLTVTIEDTTAPTITGDNEVHYDLGSAEPDWTTLVTAVDNLDNEITITTDHVDASAVKMNELGSYDVIYTVTDSQGNEGTKTIKVIVEDKVAPVITGEHVKIELGNPEPDWVTHVTAVDNVDGEITIIADYITSTVVFDQLGQYTVTYNVPDASGNVGTKIIYVTVAEHVYGENYWYPGGTKYSSYDHNNYGLAGYAVHFEEGTNWDETAGEYQGPARYYFADQNVLHNSAAVPRFSSYSILYTSSYGTDIPVANEASFYLLGIDADGIVSWAINTHPSVAPGMWEVGQDGTIIRTDWTEENPRPDTISIPDGGYVIAFQYLDRYGAVPQSVGLLDFVTHPDRVVGTQAKVIQFDVE